MIWYITGFVTVLIGLSLFIKKQEGKISLMDMIIIMLFSLTSFIGVGILLLILFVAFITKHGDKKLF